MNDAAPPPEDAIKAIRDEFDGVDKALLDLVAQRMRLADRLAGLKPADGLPMRPGREVQLLRALAKSAEPPVEPELVVEVWRALIAASLRRQRKIDVAVGGMRSDPARIFDIARRHFGARTRIQQAGEPQAALQRAIESPDTCVAVVPWPAAPGVGAWWPALSENRFRQLHLIAGLPLQGGGEDPEAAVFAATPNEEAGGDISVIMAFDPHHRLQRALNESGLVGKEFGRAEPRVLIKLEGFFGVNDARVAALTAQGLDGVRVLGSYARI